MKKKNKQIIHLCDVHDYCSMISGMEWMKKKWVNNLSKKE